MEDVSEKLIEVQKIAEDNVKAEVNAVEEDQKYNHRKNTTTNRKYRTNRKE